MKSTLFITCALSALLVSCQSEPDYASNYRLPSSSTTPQPQTHLALPGQAAVAVDSETDDAFDRQAQAYAGNPTAFAGSSYTSPAPAQPVTDPVVADALSTLPGTGSNAGNTAALYGTSGYNAAAPSTPAATSTAAPGTASAPVTPAPAAPIYNVPTTTPAAPTVITQPRDGTSSIQPIVTPQPVVQQPVVQPDPQPVQSDVTSGPIDYSVKIINTTTGRLFVEAQDASGEIYPVGFLTSGTSSTINKTQAAPIKGPITVVIRDPDKPDTPEIRRYKVELPTESYANKTLGISIVPGGIYHASLDGRVYYTSPGER